MYTVVAFIVAVAGTVVFIVVGVALLALRCGCCWSCFRFCFLFCYDCCFVSCWRCVVSLVCVLLVVVVLEISFSRCNGSNTFCFWKRRRLGGFKVWPARGGQSLRRGRRGRRQRLRATMSCSASSGSLGSASAVAATAKSTGAKLKGNALIQRALELRAKYRVSAELVRISPIHIGFHPSNRGGVPPSSERCKQLLQAILETGFDPQAADCNGVLVQEKPGSLAIQAFNNNACKDDPMMAPLVRGQTIGYGTLSHSHLNQILKNIFAQLELGIPEISGTDGKCCVQTLSAVDARFAEAVQRGLLWEVLSHEINDDPDATDIIQAACNAQNAVAMVASEVECLKKLSKFVVESASVVGGVLDYPAIRDRVKVTQPEMAADDDFEDFFSFVVGLGGNKNPFIADLTLFIEKMVNQKAWHLFGGLWLLPEVINDLRQVLHYLFSW